MIFWHEKEEKNCASKFEAKKAVMGDERLSVASRHVARLVASQLYRNGL
jgi:hypothetical protein